MITEDATRYPDAGVEVGDVVTWKAGFQPEQGATITINASFWNQAEVAATLTSIRRGGVLIWSVESEMARLTEARRIYKENRRE
jgi:hypothetical protein